MTEPPGPPARALVGHTLDVLPAPYRFFTRVWREHGDVVLLRFGPVRYYLLNDPDAIRHVLVDAARNYPKSANYEAFRPLLGQGLLTSGGELWRRQRRLVQPLFHRECLARFAETMANEAERTVAAWARLPDGEVDVHHEMATLAFRIVGRTLFDTDVEGDGAAVAHALKVGLHLVDRRVRSMVRLPVWIPTPHHLRFRAARRTLDDVMNRIIDAADGSEPGARRSAAHDVVSLLTAARDPDTGASMSAAQIRDEVMTLALAGYETTSNALSWALYLLSIHPEIEAALHRELTEVLGDRAPTFDDLPRLGLTQRVIQEAMRLFPPVWKIERQAIADDVVGGFEVPAGAIVAMTMHTLHRHPRHWPNPEGFDPRRFEPEVARDRPKHAYLPFGGGARMCIGASFAMMEAQIVLAAVLRRFRLALSPRARVRVMPGVTLHPRHGLPMLRTRR